MGTDAPGTGLDADFKVLLEHGEAFSEQKQEIVLIGHSYGGIPACIATRGNSVKEHALRGHFSVFRHVIFYAAFAVPEVGLSSLTTVSGA